MSLIDELPTKQIAFSRINIALHDELSKDVERFEAKGGKIKYCASGETADNRDKPQTKEYRNYPAKDLESAKRGAQNGADTIKLTAKLKKGKF